MQEANAYEEIAAEANESAPIISSPSGILTRSRKANMLSTNFIKIKTTPKVLITEKQLDFEEPKAPPKRTGRWSKRLEKIDEKRLENIEKAKANITRYENQLE